MFSFAGRPPWQDGGRGAQRNWQAAYRAKKSRGVHGGEAILAQQPHPPAFFGDLRVEISVRSGCRCGFGQGMTKIPREKRGILGRSLYN